MTLARAGARVGASLLILPQRAVAILRSVAGSGRAAARSLCSRDTVDTLVALVERHHTQLQLARPTTKTRLWPTC
jgi:hypothetical protein